MKRRKIKIIIGLLGVAVTVCGWAIGNAERYPFVYRVIAPKYWNAIYVIEKINSAKVTDEIVLNEGDDGFPVLTEYLEEGLVAYSKSGKKMSNAELKITKVTMQKQLGSIKFFGDGSSKTVQNIELEISVVDKNGQTLTQRLELEDLPTQLKANFLANRGELLSDFVFWTGIAFSIVSIIL